MVTWRYFRLPHQKAVSTLAALTLPSPRGGEEEELPGDTAGRQAVVARGEARLGEA